jgi:hypothetical protein
MLTVQTRASYHHGSLRDELIKALLDGPLEGRCVSLRTTPQELTSQIATLLEALLTRPADPVPTGPAQA